jgi:hypothetical protein
MKNLDFAVLLIRFVLVEIKILLEIFQITFADNSQAMWIKRLLQVVECDHVHD